MKDKLIPMTKFVTEQMKDEKSNVKRILWRIEDYANFLQQPLTLGMFVPVRQDGVILTEPNPKETSQEAYPYDLRDWHEAKKKVLFAGCAVLKVRDYYVVYYNSQSIWISWTNRVIEDLIKHEIELTESAKKLLGYEK